MRPAVALSPATLRPYTELANGPAIRFALTWQIVGLLLLVSHILLVKQSVVLFPVSIVLLMWLYVNAPLAGMIVFLQFMMYQNWLISLLVVDMDQPTFAVLQGSNFAALVAMAAIGWMRLWSRPWRSMIGPVLGVCLLALLLAVGYAVLGAAQAGPTSAAIYFRQTTSLVLAVFIGLDVGRVWGYRTVAIGFLVSMVFSLGISIVEWFDPVFYYDLINGVSYSNLKINDERRNVFSPLDIIDLNLASNFNVSGSEGGPQQIRFMGTTMHPISYAYVIAAVGLVGWSIKQTGWLLVAIPLLVLAAVKGPAVLFICTFVLWFVWYWTQSRVFLLGCGALLMTAYIGFGILSGQQTGDYHVIGFLGGVRGFVANPLGHGLGVGGNLSAAALPGINWQRSQHLGETDFAMESAIGVLLYQIGIAIVAILAVFFILIKMAPFGVLRNRRIVPSRYDILFIALISVAVNGVYQEEAYAPYAAGLYTLLCAILVANGRRPFEQQRSTTSETMRATVLLHERA